MFVDGEHVFGDEKLADRSSKCVDNGGWNKKAKALSVHAHRTVPSKPSPTSRSNEVHAPDRPQHLRRSARKLPVGGQKSKSLPVRGACYEPSILLADLGELDEINRKSRSHRTTRPPTLRYDTSLRRRQLDLDTTKSATSHLQTIHIHRLTTQEGRNRADSERGILAISRSFRHSICVSRAEEEVFVPRQEGIEYTSYVMRICRGGSREGFPGIRISRTVLEGGFSQTYTYRCIRR